MLRPYYTEEQIPNDMNRKVSNAMVAQINATRVFNAAHASALSDNRITAKEMEGLKKAFDAMLAAEQAYEDTKREWRNAGSPSSHDDN